MFAHNKTWENRGFSSSLEYVESIMVKIEKSDHNVRN
jgi:hypothetical protein